MSSRAFRSVIKRREHQERHQPAARARFGLLEKKKDYVVRAKAFHSKENRIKALRKKAENRNPDEFYFKMLSSKTRESINCMLAVEMHAAPPAGSNLSPASPIR